MPKPIATLIMTTILFLSVMTAQAAEMTVSAAASLTNAFEEMKNAFIKENADLLLHTNYAASNPLLRQILEGAPVDVFASADQATMDKAQEAKVIDPSTRANFAVNELVVIVPKNSPKPKTLADLEKIGHIAIGDPASVPAGRYAREAFSRAGVWESLEDNYIYAQNVRQALDYVARGEVEAGIVYGTDAKQMADKVDVAIIISSLSPISYPIAVAITGNNPSAGQKFINFVLSDKGQAILAKYGFARPQ